MVSEICEWTDKLTNRLTCNQILRTPPGDEVIQEGLAVASIVRDDPSTLPGDDPFPCAHMHRDHNGR